MKKTYSVLLFLICFNLGVHSQMYIGLGGNNIRQGASANGWGGSIGVFGEIIPISKNITNNYFHLIMGSQYYYSKLGSAVVRDIPLISPQTGNASVKLTNSCWGLNYSGKIVFGKRDARISPYCVGMIGYHQSSCNMKIMPDLVSYNQTNVDSNFWHAASFLSGIGAGCMIRLSERTYFDISAMYCGMTGPGKIVDLNSARKISNYLDYGSTKLSSDMLIFKAGIVFQLDMNKSDDHGEVAAGSSPGHNHSHYHNYHILDGLLSHSGSTHAHIHIHSR